MFAANSRYLGLEIALHRAGDADPVPYVRRRLLPDPATLTVTDVHVVADGDRLDRIAAHYFDDPERFWQVADANPVLDPAELTARLGRRLAIALAAVAGGSPRAF